MDALLGFAYDLLFQPLVYAIGLVFAVLYRALGNAGLAIVGLSLFVNIACAPLYRRADELQREERDRQKGMERWVGHIKAHFKGDERYMMLSTYYRQRGYRQVYALRSSISLLLQIPFFVAAYAYLSDVPLLVGTPFLGIPDLGAPDGMLTLGGSSINVLPVLMTALNCASTYVYTKDLGLSDKLQAYGLAGLFLVLLYKSPAGLVLYWTCNQVFSLVRNVLRGRELPTKAVCVALGVVGALVCVVLFATGRAATPLRTILVISLTALCEVVAVAGFVGIKPPLIGGGEVDVEASPSAPLFLEGAATLAVLCGLFIPSTLIVASPLEFAEATSKATPLAYLAHSTAVFAGTFLVWGGVYYFLGSAKRKRHIAWGFAIAALVGVADFFLLGRNLGTITSSLVFEQAFGFSAREIGVSVVILAAVGVAVWFLCDRHQLLQHGLVVVCLACAALGMRNVFRIGSALSGASVTSVDAQGQEQPGYAYGTRARSAFNDDGSVAKSIRLSKTERNVVVLFMDRAMGLYVPYLLEERPDLAQEFDGFTFYSNALSHGRATVFTGPSIYGGYEYVPSAMNERTDELMVNKHDEALKVLPSIFRDAGYAVSLIDPPLVSYTYGIPDYTTFDDCEGFDLYHVEGAYVEEYEDSYLALTEEARERNVCMYSLMKALPAMFQPILYDAGNYFSCAMNHPLNQEFINSYTVLERLEAMTDADAEGPNLTILHDHTAHAPEQLQQPDYVPATYLDNRAYADLTPTEVGGRVMSMDRPEYVAHYDVNMACWLKLGEWFDYLREEGVYDNTRIVIVSDHGYPMHQFADLEFLDGENVQMYNPLMMVKDFGATGFTTSDEFMTCADTPLLALAGIVDNPVNPFTGNMITSGKGPGMVQLVTSSWHHNAEEQTGTTLDTSDGRWLVVTDDVFDLDDWRYVG